jgi:hypothetical protein
MYTRLSRIALLAVPAMLALPSCEEKTTSTPVTPGVPSQPSQPAAPPVSTNRPPTVQFYDIQPPGAALVGGTSVDIAVRGSDPDGDTLSYTWEFGDGETVANTGAGISHVFLQEGDIGVSVTVSDGKGGQGTAFTRIPARKLSGSWRVDNARHFNITAEINHRNGSDCNGTMSDGATFSCTVSHPRHITLRLSAANGLCIPSGTYNGDFNPELDSVTFPGATCRNFSLVRQ